MIELRNSHLSFSFPEVHRDAKVSIDFQRTLRIPDDGKEYPLPPGMGSFPLKHVDDHADRLDQDWIRHGGVMLPIYQAEAMWLMFRGHHVSNRGTQYPFAIKIATGKINAISGGSWAGGLNRKPQDYVVVPEQPWLDGYCVKKGQIRQFVAMPLGAGYSAEEQLTGDAEFGGLQIEVFPMKADVFQRRFPERREEGGRAFAAMDHLCACAAPLTYAGMGLAPGGRMRQEIFDDPFDLADWDLDHSSRCFVHLLNSMVWRSITGEEPPATPVTAAEYGRAGLPWFDYYDEGASAVSGSKKLAGLKSVAEMGQAKGALPENESVVSDPVVKLRKPGQVREGVF